MRIQSLVATFLIFALLPYSSSAENRPEELSLTVDAALERALRENAGIKAAQKRLNAALQVPEQAGALPDPGISYLRFGESVQTRLGPQENVFSLSQRLPFPGKLSLKSEMAKEDAVVSRQALAEISRDVIYQTRTTYYELFLLDQSIAILDQYLSLLNDFTQVAQQKYATGQGIQANVLKSQVEISAVMDRRLDFEKLRTALESQLSSILGLPETTSIARISKIDTFSSVYDIENLIRVALSDRQDLNAHRALIRKFRLGKSLAKRNYLPDFSVQASYIDIGEEPGLSPDAGRNAWSVMVGINLPLWLGKRRAGVNQADELLAAEQVVLEDLQNRIKIEIRNLCLQLELSTKNLALYRQGLLVQAESSLASALAGYSAGNIDFLDLLDAQRMLLNFRLGHVREMVNYQKNVAALERAVGGNLPK